MNKDETTTIRIKKTTKTRFENLDFVKKNTHEEILKELIDRYEKNIKVTKRK